MAGALWAKVVPAVTHLTMTLPLSLVTKMRMTSNSPIFFSLIFVEGDRIQNSHLIALQGRIGDPDIPTTR